jgi:helix-turn-helix protein
MARRIEIIAFERERFVKKTTTSCNVCGDGNRLLTAAQAAAMAQVCVRSVYRWLAEGKVHSAITPGGHHRICRSSLLRFRDGWRPRENPSAPVAKSLGGEILFEQRQDFGTEVRMEETSSAADKWPRDSCTDASIGISPRETDRE